MKNAELRENVNYIFYSFEYNEIMNQFLLFLVLVVLIFFLSRNFGKKFFGLWYLITRNKFWSVWLTAVFLLPGTIIHELSHWLTAEILQVPTGEFDYLPKYEDGVGIKMASVKIGKVDFARRTIVGLAPFFSGIILISIMSSMLNFAPEILVIIKTIILSILIFSLSLSMFSSKTDLEVAFPFFAIIVILFGVYFWFELNFLNSFFEFLLRMIEKINKGFLIAIGIDLVFLGGLKVVTWVFERILKRKIVIK